MANISYTGDEFCIRPETERDFAEVYLLVKSAFQTASVSDGDEQDYVTALRNSKKYIPGLSFVMLRVNEMIGHIMLTETVITRPDGPAVALLLSPVCIKHKYRNKGAGSWLITQSMLQAKVKGYEAVFLVGDPAYYNRLGFKEAKIYGIQNTLNIPEQYVLCIELNKGFLGTSGGTISVE